jgi:uncharacterized protein (TIRG00374 family)
MKKYTSYLSLTLGLMIMGALIYSAPSVFQRMLSANLLYMLYAFLMTLAIILLTAYRWWLLLEKSMDYSPPLFGYLVYYVLTGASIGMFVPNRDLGEMGVRIASVKLYHQVPFNRVMLSVIVDRIFDIFILIPISIISIPFFCGWISSYLSLAALTLIALLCITGILNYKQAYDTLFRLIQNLYIFIYPRWRRLPLLCRIRLPEPQTFGLLSEVISPQIMTKAFILTSFKYLALALRAFFIACALNLNISFSIFFLSTSLAQASMILAFTPGGLGINELGWYGALSLLGVKSPQIIPFLISHRLFCYVFVLSLTLIGQIVHLYYRYRHNS